MLITYSGAQSSGKSTLLQKCKEIYKDKFQYVEEITRKVKAKGLPINEQGNNLTQLLILNSHIENSLLQNAILDRCILDGLIYTQYLFKHKKVDQWVADYSIYLYQELITKYDYIFYTEPVDLENDGVRSINKEFREEILDKFEKMMKFDKQYLRNKVIRLTGSVEERMKKIAETIKIDPTN
jgi:nicotinamide riboside kinase